MTGSPPSARDLFDAVMDRIEGELPDGTVTVVINQEEFLTSLKWCLEEAAKLEALREEIGWPEYIRRYYRIVPGKGFDGCDDYFVIDEAEPKTEEFNWGIACMGCPTYEDAQAFINEEITRHEGEPEVAE